MRKECADIFWRRAGRKQIAVVRNKVIKQEKRQSDSMLGLAFALKKYLLISLDIFRKKQENKKYL